MFIQWKVNNGEDIYGERQYRGLLKKKKDGEEKEFNKRSVIFVRKLNWKLRMPVFEMEWGKVYVRGYGGMVNRVRTKF